MKERILRGWNFGRVLYLLLGSIMIIQAISMHEWLGIILGGYLASMGIFAFGCAGGNCFAGALREDASTGNSKAEAVNYEEIK
ncbi:MAG: hypothetical protein ACHQET_05115 [Chitinophagales bacterium]